MLSVVSKSDWRLSRLLSHRYISHSACRQSLKSLVFIAFFMCKHKRLIADLPLSSVLFSGWRHDKSLRTGLVNSKVVCRYVAIAVNWIQAVAHFFCCRSSPWTMLSVFPYRRPFHSMAASYHHHYISSQPTEHPLCPQQLQIWETINSHNAMAQQRTISGHS